MGNYVVINLAEEMGVGVTAKVQDALQNPLGQKQAPASNGKKGKKGGADVAFSPTNTVKKYELVGEHDGQNGFDRKQVGFWFGLGIDRLLEIRRDCLNADVVYLCAHGSATNRGQVFAEVGDSVGSKRVEVIATVGELGDFVEMILDPASAKPYNLVLVICFAARSGDADKVHSKDFLTDAAKLSSSLAYKLFKQLIAGGVKLRMTARLGETRVAVAQTGDKWAMGLVTQTEAAVLAGLEMSEKAKAQVALGQSISAKTQDDLRLGKAAPSNPNEVAWLKMHQEIVRLKGVQMGEDRNTEKGLLVYEMVSDKLVISFEGDVIYNGGML